jgi:hypothetical protein
MALLAKNFSTFAKVYIIIKKLALPAKNFSTFAKTYLLFKKLWHSWPKLY